MAQSASPSLKQRPASLSFSVIDWSTLAGGGVAGVAATGRLGDEHARQRRERQHAAATTSNAAVAAAGRRGGAAALGSQRGGGPGGVVVLAARGSRRRRGRRRRARARGPRGSGAGTRAGRPGRSSLIASRSAWSTSARSSSVGDDRGVRRQRASAADTPARATTRTTTGRIHTRPANPDAGGISCTWSPKLARDGGADLARGSGPPPRAGRSRPGWPATPATSESATDWLSHTGHLSVRGDRLDLLLGGARRAVVERGATERHDHQRGDDDPAAAAEPGLREPGHGSAASS